MKWIVEDGKYHQMKQFFFIECDIRIGKIRKIEERQKSSNESLDH